MNGFLRNFRNLRKEQGRGFIAKIEGMGPVFRNDPHREQRPTERIFETPSEQGIFKNLVDQLMVRARKGPQFRDAIRNAHLGGWIRTNDGIGGRLLRHGFGFGVPAVESRRHFRLT